MGFRFFPAGPSSRPGVWRARLGLGVKIRPGVGFPNRGRHRKKIGVGLFISAQESRHGFNLLRRHGRGTGRVVPLAVFLSFLNFLPCRNPSSGRFVPASLSALCSFPTTCCRLCARRSISCRTGRRSASSPRRSIRSRGASSRASPALSVLISSVLPNSSQTPPLDVQLSASQARNSLRVSNCNGSFIS